MGNRSGFLSGLGRAVQQSLSAARVLDWLDVREQPSAPATPPSAFGRFYAKVKSGVSWPYWKDDGGNEHDLLLGGSGGGASTLDDLADVTITSPASGQTIRNNGSGQFVNTALAHTDLSSVGTDDHHAKSHAHSGADGSGTVAHSATTGQTANDHHNQSHAHNGADSSGTVAHAATTGITANDHHAQSHDHSASGDNTALAPVSVAPSGLTGATHASRYVGATNSGAPGSGTFAVGDFIVDRSGTIWICTTAGTPGTWTQVVGNATQSGEITGTDFKATGLTGATAASRYVGATTSGAPVSGTFAVGDFIIDQTGKFYLCTTAGSPGTWTQAGGGSGANTADHFVTTSADSDLSAKTVISGLVGSADVKSALGGGGTTAAGISEDYDTTTTGLSWSPSTPATVDSHTTVSGHLFIKTTDATERLGLRSWSPGSGAFDARMHIAHGMETTTAGNSGMGLVITDSGNNNRLLLQLSGTQTTQSVVLQAHTYTSSTYTQRGSNWTIPTQIYLRISRDGSNNVSFFWSDTGKDGSWRLVATQSFSLTVANIGVRVAGRGASSDDRLVSDWLRTSV